jgi:hypothetical protein
MFGFPFTSLYSSAVAVFLVPGQGDESRHCVGLSYRGRIQRKTCCMGPMPKLTITSPYVHFKVDSNTFTTDNPMPVLPESTLVLNPMPESTLSPSQGLGIWPHVRQATRVGGPVRQTDVIAGFSLQSGTMNWASGSYTVDSAKMKNISRWVWQSRSIPSVMDIGIGIYLFKQWIINGV